MLVNLNEVAGVCVAHDLYSRPRGYLRSENMSNVRFQLTLELI